MLTKKYFLFISALIFALIFHSNLLFVNAQTITPQTTTPTLIAPISTGTYHETIAIQYILPDTPGSNTVRLTFFNTSNSNTIVLYMDEVMSQNFSLQRSSLFASGHVTSVAPSTSSIPYGNYNVTLSYQDASFNPAASVTVSNVTIVATPTATPSATATSTLTPSSTPIPTATVRKTTAPTRIPVSTSTPTQAPTTTIPPTEIETSVAPSEEPTFTATPTTNNVLTSTGKESSTNNSTPTFAISAVGLAVIIGGFIYFLTGNKKKTKK